MKRASWQDGVGREYNISSAECWGPEAEGTVAVAGRAGSESLKAVRSPDLVCVAIASSLVEERLVAQSRHRPAIALPDQNLKMM